MTYRGSGILRTQKGGKMKTSHFYTVLGVWMLVVVLMGAIHCGNGYRHMGPWGAGPWHMMAYGYGGLFMWILSLVALAIVIYFVIQSTRSRSPYPTARWPITMRSGCTPSSVSTRIISIASLPCQQCVEIARPVARLALAQARKTFSSFGLRESVSSAAITRMGLLKVSSAPMANVPNAW